jgi:branched-chain amino acid transport system substrate-binding protein
MSIVGCGGQSSSKSGGSEEIKIGFYGPITGPSSVMGTPSVMGARFAVDEINAKGGINGKKIKLIEYDDKSQPELAVKAVTRMIEVDKVHAIVGSLHSGNILASAPVVEKAQIPEVGTGTSSVWLTKGYKYLFRGTVSSGFTNPMLAKTIKDFGYKKVAILSSSTEFAKNGTEELIKELEKAGVAIVDKESHNNGDTDFTGQIAKMLSSGADAMIVYGGAEDCGPQMKQFRQLGYKGEVFGIEGFGAAEVRKVAGDAANGAVFGAAYLIPDSIDESFNDREKKFLTAWKAKFNEMPTFDTAYRSYDSVMIIAEAIKNAKSLNGPDLRDAIENLTSFEGLAGTYNFKGHNGEGIFQMRMFGIANGKYLPLDKYIATRKK